MNQTSNLVKVQSWPLACGVKNGSPCESQPAAGCCGETWQVRLWVSGPDGWEEGLGVLAGGSDLWWQPEKQGYLEGAGLPLRRDWMYLCLCWPVRHRSALSDFLDVSGSVFCEQPSEMYYLLYMSIYNTIDNRF